MSFADAFLSDLLLILCLFIKNFVTNKKRKKYVFRKENAAFFLSKFKNVINVNGNKNAQKKFIFY